MKLADVSIRRPVFALMMSAAIVVLGIASYTQLGLDLMPKTDFPMVVVRTSLPGAWTSTANQLERRAFTLQDVLFVVDDYAPQALDHRELETKASRLLRAQGNLSGRGRLRADLSERPAMPPRGLILSTGEDRPGGRSILARTLLLELDRAQVDLARLSAAQQLASRPLSFVRNTRCHHALHFEPRPGGVTPRGKRLVF